MAEISQKTKQWLFDKYSYYTDEKNDSHYWEYEHKRAVEMLGILGEIINGLGLNKDGNK